MILPKQLQAYVSGSEVFGQYGTPWDASVGLNWYPNQVFRVMLDIDRVRIDRLSPNATVFQTPTGAQIGQSYTAIAVRTQAAF